MPDPIDFYFDFRSPYAYLAMTQLPALAARTGRAVCYRPVDVLALMGEVGNRPTSIECPAKRRYVGADLGRWGRLYGLTLTSRPRAAECNAPVLLNAAVAAEVAGVAEAFNRLVFDAIWSDGTVIDSADALACLIRDSGSGIDPGIADKLTADDSALGGIRADAVAAGVFGVPTFAVEGQLFFGNDRLEHLERALAR